MTVNDLKELISDRESMTLEFKRDAPLSDSDLLEAIVCLANAEGGILLLGVEDNGQISGLHPSHLPLNTYLLEAFLSNRTVPSVRITIELVVVENSSVAVIDVGKARSVVATSDGKMIKRFIDGAGKPGCRPLYPTELASHLSAQGQFDWSAQATNATWEDFDPLEFERVRQLIAKKAIADKTLLSLSNTEFAQALQLIVTRDGQSIPTMTGLLLLGRQGSIARFIPTHEAAFQVIADNRRVAVNEFFREPLVKLFERFEELLELRNQEQELSVGMFRVGVPLFQMDAYREALSNALTHRDYARLGKIFVRIDPDEGGVIISNPGGFVEGVTVENMLVIEPKPRNPVLANAFKRIGLAETTGRGIDRIFGEILRTGRSAPQYDVDISTVKLMLPNRDPDLRFVQVILQMQDRIGRELSWMNLLVLRTLIDHGELSLAEASRLLQRPEPRARSLLEEMLDQGLIEGKTNTQGRSYHLSAGIYRSLGRPEAFVQRKATESTNSGERVLEYARTFGSVRREDVLKLVPHLKPYQASYLLQSMVKSELLEPHGEKRGRSYQVKEKTS
jgi:ATP-dependent DNA helicase RecG